MVGFFFPHGSNYATNGFISLRDCSVYIAGMRKRVFPLLCGDYVYDVIFFTELR